MSANSIKDINIVTANMAKGIKNELEPPLETTIEPILSIKEVNRESDEDVRSVMTNDAGVPQDLVTSTN